MVATASLTWENLSSSTQAAFQFAAGLAAGSEAQQTAAQQTPSVPVSSRMLLIGIADAHPDPASTNRNPLLDLLLHFSLGRVDLDEEVASSWGDQPRPLGLNPARHRRLTLVDLPPMRGHAPEVLQAAAGLMNGAKDRPARLPLRYLFGGMLLVPESGAYRTLDSMLSGRADLSAIAEAYHEFLDEPDERRFTGFLADRFQSTAPFARTVADTTVGKDLLGRGKLIGDMARWLSVRNLQTPLAIGLFGDWGSGKSFFMARLSEEIQRIAEGARGRPKSAFCSHVVQVNFNAWLYSDSEIWPSLATQVFRAAAGVDTEAADAASLEEIRRYWQQQSPAYAAAQQRSEDAATGVRQAEATLGALDEKIKESQKQLADRVGEFGPKAKQAVEDGRSVAAAISAGRQTFESLRQLTPLAKVGLVLLALVGLAALVVAVLNPSVLATIAAVLGLVGTAAGLITRVLNATRSAIDEYGNQVALQQRRAEAAETLTAAVETQAKAEAERSEVAEVGLIDAFASDQATRWKSRERLGAVTEIRQAFARLSKIISKAHEDAKASGDAKAPSSAASGAESTATGVTGRPDSPPIDRIVVYIDDLDRCQPDLVVKVLEAVKLLMDLEHFVVIVGVDSRWLLRSLQIQFRELLSGDGTAGGDTDDGWAATPQNYLEKIFQFSLMLPPITTEGYERLVLELLRADGSGTDDHEEESTNAEAATGGDGTPSAAERIAPEPGSTESGLGNDNPTDLVLHDEELDTIRGLARLIQTPRSAKRLTNVYRLMRVTYGEQRLLDNDAYVRVLLLLGIVVGYPRQSAEVLTALDKADATMDWTTFVGSLAPRPRVGPTVDRSYWNDARPTMSWSEAVEWAGLSHVLLGITADEKWAFQASAFSEWLPRVADYTFHPWRRGGLPGLPPLPMAPTAPGRAGS